MPTKRKKVNLKVVYYPISVIFSFLIISIAGIADARTVKISGRLLGADQKPISQSHVVVSRFFGGADHFLVKRVSPNGKFHLTLTNEKTFHLLFTGIYHAPARVYFYDVDRDEVKIDVSLARKNFHRNGSEMKLLGNFNHFRFSSAISLKKINQNKYQASFPTKLKKIHYLVYKSHKDRGGLSAGTHQESAVYRRWGYYTSIMTPKNGWVTIKIDVSRWLRLPQSKMSLRFIGNHKGKRFHSELSRLRSFVRVLESFRKKASYSQDQHLHPSLIFKKMGMDVAGRIRKIEESLKNEKQLFLVKLKLLKILAIKYKSAASVNQDLSKKICKHLPPDDPIWSFLEFPSLALMYIAKGRFFGECYQESKLQSIQDPYLKVRVIRSLSYQNKSNRNRIRRYRLILHELLKKYRIERKVPFLKRRINRLLKRMDRFVTSTAIKKVPISLHYKILTSLRKKKLKKITLLHVWSTWCSACVSGIRRIQGLPDSVKKKINIISISFDENFHRIKKFQKKLPMPWINLIESQGFQSQWAKAMSLDEIPYMLLLGKDGKIVLEQKASLQKNLVSKIQKHIKN